MRSCAKMRCGNEPMATVSLVYTERQVVVTDGQLRLVPGAKVEIKGEGAAPVAGARAGRGTGGPPARRDSGGRPGGRP